MTRPPLHVHISRLVVDAELAGALDRDPGRLAELLAAQFRGEALPSGKHMLTTSIGDAVAREVTTRAGTIDTGLATPRRTTGAPR